MAISLPQSCFGGHFHVTLDDPHDIPYAVAISAV